MEMTTAIQIEIENLKCGGCEKSILKGLATMGEISDVMVRDAVVNKLRSMGYPEKDSLSGLDAGLANAKSFVSCAIGRVS
jgi:copper chaperone